MDRYNHQSSLQYIPESEGKFKHKVNKIILFTAVLKNTHLLYPICVIQLGIEFGKKFSNIFILCVHIPVGTHFKKSNNKYIFGKPKSD
jgi:hypothetical protein